MNYKVLITTSGIGSRLGELTNYTNKALIRVGKKPAISYIVERYPDEIELVITLGYFGNHVKDFLELAYPQKNFTFVNVDKYEGEGTSLGYSMLQAKEHLQCPFIYHASDTIILDKNILEPDKNWIGGSFGKDSSQYRTISNNKWTNPTINEKGAINFDSIYIGLAGIYEYDTFWNALEEGYNKNPNDSSLSDCYALNKLRIDDVDLVRQDNWFDIGNSSELKKTREQIPDKFEILDKVDESIFLFDDFVIKFFYDKEVCKNRVERNLILEGLVPKLHEYTDNFYKYEYVKGVDLCDVVNEKIFEDFLNYLKDNLWINKHNDEIFREKCIDFYVNKTNKRIDKFLKDNNLEDKITIINGIEIPPIKELLKQIPYHTLVTDYSNNFHGDLVLNNIIYNIENKKFTLIDWRQDFAGNLKDGDFRYDLSKLSHNLIFNHEIVNKGLYKLEIKKDEIVCDILCSKNLLECQKVLDNFILNNGCTLFEINIIRAIIWVNMSGVHEGQLGNFLFYFGKLNLYKALNS